MATSACPRDDLLQPDDNVALLYYRLDKPLKGAMIPRLADPIDNFALAMEANVKGLMIDRADQNQDIVTRYLNGPQFLYMAFRLLVNRIHDEIRCGKGEAVGGGA